MRLRVNGFEPWASVTGAGWFNPDALPPAAVELKVSELNLPSPSYSDDLENLVHNGGFEEPLSDDGNPPHWRFFRHREEEGIGFTLDTEDRTEGQQSLKTHFPGATGAWRIEHTERIPARPGERFRLEATMRRDPIIDPSGADRCDVWVHAYDADGNQTGRGVGIVYCQGVEWRTDTHEFETPPGTAYLTLVLSDYGYYMFQGCNLWFDDIRLYRVPEQEAYITFDLAVLNRVFEAVDLAADYRRTTGIWWEAGPWTSTDETTAHWVEVYFRADKLLDGLEIQWPQAPQACHAEVQQAGDDTWYEWPHPLHATDSGLSSWGPPVKACSVRIAVLPGDGPAATPNQLSVTEVRIHQRLPR